MGESGCGKTTTGRCLLQLYRPTAGQIFFEGKELTKLKARAIRRLRRAKDICKEKEPDLIDIGSGHWVACHLVK